jgi:mono/diheme cytochrome c family protein
MKKVLLILMGIAAVIFIGIQFVPYGHQHSNPPVVQEPNWDSSQTRELAQRACFDCHSNETDWPWYSYVAPVSWLIQRDAEVGRRIINFSDWGRVYEPGEIVEVVREGEMPPAQYLLMHPEARLTQAEKDAFISGIQATISQSGQ